MEIGVGVKRLAGVAEEDGVCAGGKVAESVVNQVCVFASNYVADRAEVVGQGPEDFGGGCVGEEFVLLVRRPEVVVGNIGASGKHREIPILPPAVRKRGESQ